MFSVQLIIAMNCHILLSMKIEHQYTHASFFIFVSLLKMASLNISSVIREVTFPSP